MMVMGDLRWAPDDGRWGQGMRHGPWVTGWAMGGCNPVNIHRRPSAFYQFLQGFQPLSNCLPILRPRLQVFAVSFAVFAAPPRLLWLFPKVLTFYLRLFCSPPWLCRFACGFRRTPSPFFALPHGFAVLAAVFAATP